MRGPILIVIAAGSLLGAAPARGAPEVDAGALRAEITADPWHLELTDARGRTVLAEATSSGPGPAGALGFRSAGLWQHATRVLSSDASAGVFSATLATTDPARTMTVSRSAGPGGVIDLGAGVDGPVDAIGIGFQARGGERYVGFGERSNAVDQSGGVVENYVSDGPYQAGEYP